MNRPYTEYSRNHAPYSPSDAPSYDEAYSRAYAGSHSGNSGGYSSYSLTPAERIGHTDDPYGPSEYEGLQEYEGLREYPADAKAGAGYDDPDVEDYPTDPEYDEASIDRRWMWVAGIAGVILFVAVGTTGIILGGSDSGSVTATDDTSVADEPAAAAPSAAVETPRALVPSLPPETVTTVTPTAAAPEAPSSSQPAPPPEQATEAAPPAPAPSPRTVTYRVTGNRPLIDMVTVVYSDERGALQTDVNVALPWTKTIVLDPGVELSSVTATSVSGQLNCSITDASGNVLVAQNTNAMFASCTK
ncbi:putative transport accessory protein MmpS3 [Mycolicibacterium hassiacum DSM 44199]|nr:putative transport accessory protein MmpS3 [Mycolicibacterium hassiacum DSM 44199]